ncbi:DUF721 domain-containing protein [candidate division KSB1 bacterium]|nr:DUF721 domain-containing protein [candidate division KSB1 bacterium]
MTPIGDLITRILQRKGWQGHVLSARVATQWEAIVGPVNALHTRPARIERGRLTIECDHDTWRTELQFLKPEIIERVNEVLGKDAVREVFLR